MAVSSHAPRDRRLLPVRGAAAAALAHIGEEAEPDEPPDQSRRQEIARCLLPRVDRLAPADRDAIVLIALAGATMADAAKALGLQPAAPST